MKYYLRHVILAALILSFAKECICQRNTPLQPFVSAEVYANYPYYLQIKNPKLNYNYGGGFFIALNQRNIQFKTGVWYNTKEYFEKPTYPGNKKDRIDYHVNYYNIPFLISKKFKNDSINHNEYWFTAGLVFNNAKTFRSITHYSNGEVLSEKLNFNKQTGMSLRFGLRYAHSFNRNWFVFADLFTDLKVSRENGPSGSQNLGNFNDYSLPDDRILLGLNAGISYSLHK